MSDSLDMLILRKWWTDCKRNGLRYHRSTFVLPFGYFEAAHASRLIEIIECMRGDNELLLVR